MASLFAVRPILAKGKCIRPCFISVNGGRNPPLNGGGCFPGTIFEQRASQKSRSGVKGKRSLAKRILDAAKGQKTGPGCDLGRAHKSAFRRRLMAVLHRR